MTSLAWMLLAAAGSAAVVDWIAVGRGSRRVEHVAKPLTTALLLLAAAVLEPVDPAQRVAFVVALGASLAGDVALMFDRFTYGLGSFLVAHLAYIVGFLVRGVAWSGTLVAAVVVTVVVAAFGARIVRAVRAGRERAMVGPVVAYIAVISAMFAFAVGGGVWLAVGGAALFLTSDAMIAWNRFVAPFPAARVAITVTYHAAQALLVVSLTA